MIPILCLDSRQTLHFGGKRLSFDRCLQAKILAEIQGKTLFLSAYSTTLFEEILKQVDAVDLQLCTPEKLTERDAFKEGFVFIENSLPQNSFWKSCPEIWIFNWNRLYPRGQSFHLEEWGDFHCFYQEDFNGFSHPNITFYKYRRLI